MTTRPRAGAFSLLEAVISLGVISFAVVGVVGLFPIAMQTAREDDWETRAMLIARAIFDELESLPGDRTALVRGPSLAGPSWRIAEIDLAASSTHVLAYDADGVGLSEPAPVFDQPVHAPAVHFLAEVRIMPDDPREGISRVQAIVAAPAAAPPHRRSRFTYVTYMAQR